MHKKLFVDNPDEVCFIDNNISPKYINYGEGLSAVSFFKRCYIPEKDNEIKFPSMAEIALKELETQKQEEFDKYKRLFNEKQFPTTLINHFDKINVENFQSDFNNQFDYQYFYKENLTEKEFPNKYQLKWVKKWQSKFIQPIIGTIKNRYYAIIISDGDSMGKWLSGENLLKNNDLYVFHKKLSGSLNKFSKNAEQNLKSPQGKTVYSGGDDFMAFVNLEHLFPVMEKLNEQFAEINTDLADNSNFAIQENKKMTLSAGIAIAHYKTPLGIVLDKAREMEKLAKQNNDNEKNSFAIAVLKRSGEINQTVWKWKQDNKKYTTKILENLIQELQKENGISNTFIKNIQVEFNKLQNEKGDLSVNSLLLETEFKRLLKKSRDKNMPSENYDTILNNLKILLPKAKTKNFFMALNIADFIQRNTNGLITDKDGE